MKGGGSARPQVESRRWQRAMWGEGRWSEGCGGQITHSVNPYRASQLEAENGSR